MNVQWNKAVITKEKGKNMKTVIWILVLISFSCSNAGTELETYDKYRTQQIDYRDSLFVIHTVSEWGKLKWWIWAIRPDIFVVTYDQIKYFIPAVFYNTTKTKMIVWVGTKKPNLEFKEKHNYDSGIKKICPNGPDTIYSMSALIGIRETPNSIWKLYPFDQQMASCFNNKNEVINVLGQYYFERMADDGDYVMQQGGDSIGYRIYEPFGYNLQDEEFWEKSWLWEKDTVGSFNLYPFQIYGYDCDKKSYNRIVKTYPDIKPNETYGEYSARNGRIVMKRNRNNLKECADPFDPPAIEYPKEILELYDK